MDRQKNDFLYCKKVIKKYAKYFYYASKSLPLPKREAVWAVYALCHLTNQAEDTADRQEEYTQITQEWKAFCEGESPDSPNWRALKAVFADFALSREPFDDFIAAKVKDLTFAQPENDEELLAYCGGIAGTAARMLLPVVASQNAEELQDTAVAFGQAIRLTDILLGVGKNFERGRVYFSKKTMEKYHATNTIFRIRAVTKTFTALWEHYAKMAEGLYSQVTADLGLFDEDSQRAVRDMVFLYRALLDKVRAGGYGCMEMSYSLSFFESYRIILQKESNIEQ